MPLIEQLSKIAKSVSDTASSAAKKSADIVEITKLNLSIQSEEDKINDLKAKIGALIVEKLESGAEVDTEVFELYNKIIAIKSNITEMKKKLIELRNITVCSNCNTELTSNETFCPKCGTKQKSSETKSSAITSDSDNN